MTDEVQQEPSVSCQEIANNRQGMTSFSILFKATEKIIISSSKLINKLENIELLKGSASQASPFNTDYPNEPRPAYEIFQNLEHLILFADDDDDFFMPVVDGKYC